MAVVSSPAAAACEAATARAERCGHPAAYSVDVPGLGPRRLCGIHARFVRLHGALPGPPVLGPLKPGTPRVRRPPRVIVEPRWTPEEDAVVRAHAGESVTVSASLLNRTPWAIYARRASLKRDGGRLGRIHPKRPWTTEDYRFLAEHPKLPAREVAAELGRTTAAVYERRATLRRAELG